MKNSKVFIIIPAYNEATVIGKVIDDVQKQGYKNIIVVDDGSTDDTSLVCQKKKVILLKHLINRGKGAAAKTGLEAVKMLNGDIAVTLDGDGQHDPRDIRKLVEKIDKGYEIVLGSRIHKGNQFPIIKKIANHCGNLLVYIMYGLMVNDSQSGFRAYSKKALKAIETNHDKYEFESEIIREIVRNTLKYIEVPISVRYTKYSQTKKEKQSFTNGIKTLFKLVISQQ